VTRTDEEDIATKIVEANRKLMKPAPRPRSQRIDHGDGDHCPIDSGHGRMYVLKESNTQWCPTREHEGRPERDDRPALQPTRSFWPLGIDSFPAAVKEYNARRASAS
jgi:hypothetical protein